jgi:hypothetical protein
MAILTERQVIRLMRDEYHRRLVETIEESDIFDDRGNNLLSPGLKVRHKDSKFEYTVDSVEGGEGDVRISLKLPDEPRFEPPGEGPTTVTDSQVPAVASNPAGDASIPAEIDPPELDLPNSPDETIYVIDQAEFEKEYEVT